MEGVERGRMKQKRDVQQGTLALMVLKTLQVLGPLHGYGIARRIAQISNELLSVNQGTLYPVLLRLEQERAVASEWGPSENNRRARFYRLTRAGEKLLEAERRDWEQTTAIIARFFELESAKFSAGIRCACWPGVGWIIRWLSRSSGPRASSFPRSSSAPDGRC